MARRADPDPWRDRVRDPAVWRDGKALAELARAAPLAEQPVPLLLALGERLSATGEDGVGFLRRVREQYPEDFWANFTLALALHGAERRPGGDPAPALAYYEKALEIRPQAVAVLNDLGLVLIDKDWMWDNDATGGPGAITTFHQAGEERSPVRPGPQQPRRGPGNARAIGHWRCSCTRTPWRSIPSWPPPISTSAKSRPVRESFDEAIDHYRQALRLDPDFARAHHLLGVALVAKGRWDEADDCYPESVKPLDPVRGQALDEAIAYYWQASRL